MESPARRAVEGAKGYQEMMESPLRLFELPLCPKCQLEVISYKMNESVFYERSNARMVPLSSPVARHWGGQPILNQPVTLFDRWVCVRCGYTVSSSRDLAPGEKVI